MNRGPTNKRMAYFKRNQNQLTALVWRKKRKNRKTRRRRGKKLMGNPTDVYKSNDRHCCCIYWIDRKRGQEVKHSLGFLFLSPRLCIFFLILLGCCWQLSSKPERFHSPYISHLTLLDLFHLSSKYTYFSECDVTYPGWPLLSILLASSTSWL